MFFLFLCAIATLSTPAQSAPSPDIASNASHVAEMSLISSARRLLSDSTSSSPPSLFTNPCTFAPTGDDALLLVLYLTASLLVGTIFGLILICIIVCIRQQYAHVDVAIQQLPPGFGPRPYANVTGAYTSPVGPPPLTRPLYKTSVPSFQILMPGTRLPSFLAWPTTPKDSSCSTPRMTPGTPNTPVTRSGGDPSTIHERPASVIHGAIDIHGAISAEFLHPRHLPLSHSILLPVQPSIPVPSAAPRSAAIPSLASRN